MRNIWRLYGGWYDGDPSHLKPAPAAALAPELADLAGGAARLADRARELAAAGDLRLAGHLAELAAQAAPDDKGVHAARAEVFGARAQRGSVDDVEGHLLVGRARIDTSRHDEKASSDEDRRREDPRDRRVVGHRRRARADPRRAGRDRRDRRPARRPARGSARAVPRSTRPTRACGPSTSATSTRAEQVALEAWDAFGGLDVLVNNAAIPKRTRVTDLTPADVRARDGRRLPLPRPHERSRCCRGCSSAGAGRSCSCRAWAAASRSRTSRRTTRRSTRCAGSRRRCTSTSRARGVDVKLVLPGPIDTEIWDQPDNVPALMDIDKVPAAECAAGIADAIEDDGFEYYVPPVFPGGIDAKEIAVGKTAALRPLPARHGRLRERHPRAAGGPVSDGRSTSRRSAPSDRGHEALRRRLRSADGNRPSPADVDGQRGRCARPQHRARVPPQRGRRRTGLAYARRSRRERAVPRRDTERDPKVLADAIAMKSKSCSAVAGAALGAELPGTADAAAGRGRGRDGARRDGRPRSRHRARSKQPWPIDPGDATMVDRRRL